MKTYDAGSQLPLDFNVGASSCPATGTQIRGLGALMRPAVPTEVFATYWYFAAERQRILLRRLAGMGFPWTRDKILSTYRFTNVYRFSDRVSQYLITQVQQDDEWSRRDLFFRTILFKFFNRISTWEFLAQEVGRPNSSDFRPEAYSRVFDAMLDKGSRIYSAAYIMPSGGSKSPFRRKHDMHLWLLKRMLDDGLAEKLSGAKSMSDAYYLLLSYPSLGEFLAYQYVTDLNYSELTNFSEMEFVVAGPGAKEGIGKCFSSLGGKDNNWIISRVAEVQSRAFEIVGQEFNPLFDRPLQLIDCQNVFCEIAKYARVRHPEFTAANGRNRIKQKFAPAGSAIPCVLPKKWLKTGNSLPSDVDKLRS